MQRKPEIEKDSVFRALADPIRRSILSRLQEEPQPVAALAAQYRISRPAVSRHLKVLREARVVASRQQGQENVYYLTPGPLRQAQDFLSSFWSSRLGALKTMSEDETL